MHYAPGPVTYRPFKRNGSWWLGVYEAQHDGAGWLVVKATCRSLAMLPGDHVHVRLEVVQDLGDEVEVAIAGGRRRVSANQIMFIEEAKP